jgi:hypothetical protein
VRMPSNFLSSAVSRIRSAVITDPTCHRSFKSNLERIFASEWFFPRMRSPALSPGWSPPENPAEISSVGFVSPSLFSRFFAAPTPISPNSQTPTRRRGSCRARKHVLSNSSAKAIAIMVLFLF